MIFPLKDYQHDIPQYPHPGSFGVIRKHDIHTGIDLYCNPGAPVYAIEAGIVVAIEKNFTGGEQSPWWNDTDALLIEGKHGVWLYGEVAIPPYISVGSLIHPGQQVGEVITVLKKNKGKPMTMLHLELYEKGTRHSEEWKYIDAMPKNLLNPVFYLQTTERL